MVAGKGTRLEPSIKILWWAFPDACTTRVSLRPLAAAKQTRIWVVFPATQTNALKTLFCLYNQILPTQPVSYRANAPGGHPLPLPRSTDVMFYLEAAMPKAGAADPILKHWTIGLQRVPQTVTYKQDPLQSLPTVSGCQFITQQPREVSGSYKRQSVHLSSYMSPPAAFLCSFTLMWSLLSAPVPNISN
jgi:hypothetical protein